MLYRKCVHISRFTKSILKSLLILAIGGLLSVRLIYESHQFFALNPIFFPADGKFYIYNKKLPTLFQGLIKETIQIRSK